jgi:hypothetical protein
MSTLTVEDLFILFQSVRNLMPEIQPLRYCCAFLSETATNQYNDTSH